MWGKKEKKKKAPSKGLVWSHPTFNRPQAALHWPRDSITFPQVISWKHNTGSSSAEPGRSCKATSWLWSAPAHGSSSERAWRMLPGGTHRCWGQTPPGQGRGYLHWVCRTQSAIQAALDNCKFCGFTRLSRFKEKKITSYCKSQCHCTCKEIQKHLLETVNLQDCSAISSF